MALRKQHQVEADLVGSLQQLQAEIELRVQTTGRQRRKSLGHGLRRFR